MSIYISKAQPVLAVVLILDSKFPLPLGEGQDKEPRMNHKVTLFLLAASALVCSNLAEAQQPKKVSRIGYLSTTDAATDSARAEGIRQAAMWMSSRRTHESSYFL